MSWGWVSARKRAAERNLAHPVFFQIFSRNEPPNWLVEKNVRPRRTVGKDFPATEGCAVFTYAAGH